MFNVVMLLICWASSALHTGAHNTMTTQATESLPAIDQLIEMNIRALGGRLALTSAGTLILTGECQSSNPEESGPIEISIHTPRVYYNLGDGALQMGYSGESVWRRTQTEGLRQQHGGQFAQLVTVFDPARLLWWKDWYPEMAVKGVEKEGDRATYLIQTNPDQPGSEVLFIDRHSGLLVRDELMPGLVFTFSDYREVDGIKVPFNIKQTGPGSATYAYQFKKASLIAAPDGSRFEPR